MQENLSDGDFDSRFGANVADFRKAKSWSQRRLAEELEQHGVKLDPSAVTRIERGGREAKLREAVAIAAALGVDLRELTRMARRDPQADLAEALDSTVERRNAARLALAGMSTYYVMAIHLFEEYPELLEDLRIAAGWDGSMDIEEFLRAEAEHIAKTATPVGQISTTEEQNALIQGIVTASVANLTGPMSDDVEDDEDAET